MSSLVLKQRLTAEEYLALERAAATRSEFINGEMLAMAGGSPAHSLITTNLTIALGTRLRGGSCRAYNSELRVNVSSTGLYTYPDLTVVCEEPRFVRDEHLDTLVNPTVLVEVLSPSTEAYDRGAKFAHYQRLESLQEYVLVAQDQPRVERFARRPGAGLSEWLFTVATGRDAHITFPALGVELPLAEIYEGVRFETGTNPAETAGRAAPP